MKNDQSELVRLLTAASQRDLGSCYREKQAILERDRLLKSRYAKSQKAKGFRAVIEKCTGKKRCQSGACPVCMEKTQYNLSRATLRAIKRQAKINRRLKVFHVTVVNSRDSKKSGDLKTFNIALFSRRLKYALLNTEMVFALFGIDYSFNVDNKEKYEPHWQPHAAGLIVTTAGRKRIKEALKGFQMTKTCPTPVLVSSLSHPNRWLRYICKASFRRRSGYDRTKLDGEGLTRACRDTRKNRLLNAEKIELFCHLHECGLDSRLIVVGCQLRKNDGRLALIPIELRKADF